MSKRAERYELSVLSPLEWYAGWARLALIVLAVVPLLVVSRAHPLTFAAFAPFLLVALAASWPARVKLGEDGISYRRFGVARFIPYTAIAKTEVIQKMGEGESPRQKTGVPRRRKVYTAVRVTLESGEIVDLCVGKRDLSLPSPPPSGAIGHFGSFVDEGWKLRKAIDERVGEVREQPDPSELAKTLMRGPLPIEEWRSKIAEAAPADAGYRDARREALWRVLEDSSQPRDARAGAAMALRNDLGVEGRARLRVVADETESPKLRAILETALDEEAEEQRVLEALEKVSREGE